MKIIMTSVMLIFLCSYVNAQDLQANKSSTYSEYSVVKTSKGSRKYLNPVISEMGKTSASSIAGEQKIFQSRRGLRMNLNDLPSTRSGTMKTNNPVNPRGTRHHKY